MHAALIGLDTADMTHRQKWGGGIFAPPTLCFLVVDPFTPAADYTATDLLLITTAFLD